MKKILSLFMALCFVFAACQPEAKPDPDPVENPDNPDKPDPDDPDNPDEPDPVVKVEKDRAVWVSATANWHRLTTKGDIKTWIRKMKRYGFNEIIIEVKLMEGGVLYESEIMPQLLTYGSGTRNYDYLQYFIDQCREQDIKIGAAMTVFPTYGLGETAKYKDSDFEGRYCQEVLSSAGITDIRDNHNSGIFPFLNPADTFVHDFVLEVAEEIVSKYDIDSFTLDYCRYQNYHSDFSDTSREAFEKYIGKIVKKWPEDVYSVDENGNDKFGEYFNLYQEWRSSVITGYVKDIGEMIDRVKPDVKFEYWAASWWPLWSTGQNWTSDRRNLTSSYWWSTPDYYKTGFAKYLDVFQNGAYLSKLFPEYDGNSISYQLNCGMNYIQKDCKMYGSFSVSNNMSFDPGDAAYWILKNTDGLMVFELTHIESGSWWQKLQAGFDKALADGSAYVQ